VWFGGLLALGAQLAFTPPQVRGSGDCPSAAEVVARLEPLLPRETDQATAAAPGDVVELAPAAGGTIVRLRDPAGIVSHERTVGGAKGCAERAVELAVLVAIWEADLHAEVVFPPLPPNDEAEAPAVPPAPTAKPPRTSVRAAPRAAEPSSRGSRASLGAAFLAAQPFGAGVAPAGFLEATWSRGGPLRGRLALAATGSHAIDLPPGTVDWRRVTLGLGAMAEAALGQARLSARVDGLVAALLAKGSGFDVDEDATSWQLGGDAGVRAGLALTPQVTVWADAALAGFPGTQRVTVLNVSSAPVVSRWEGQAGVGLSFSWSP
jgi:hypothetical protein